MKENLFLKLPTRENSVSSYERKLQLIIESIYHTMMSAITIFSASFPDCLILSKSSLGGSFTSTPSMFNVDSLLPIKVRKYLDHFSLFPPGFGSLPCVILILVSLQYLIILHDKSLVQVWIID